MKTKRKIADRMRSEIDFSKGKRGLHHIPADAKVLMPNMASPHRSAREPKSNATMRKRAQRNLLLVLGKGGSGKSDAVRQLVVSLLGKGAPIVKNVRIVLEIDGKRIGIESDCHYWRTKSSLRGFSVEGKGKGQLDTIVCTASPGKWNETQVEEYCEQKGFTITPFSIQNKKEAAGVAASVLSKINKVIR